MNQRAMGFKILCFGIALLAESLRTSAATWFVATNGNDATGTGSIAAPFRTLNHSLGLASSGDVIEVRGGTYREAGEVRFRNPGITMRSYAGEWAAIVAPLDDENGYSSCIQIDPDADRTTLSRLEISGGYYYGVMLQTKWDWGDPNDRMGACHVTLEDCAIHDTGRDCVKITPNCDDVVVRRCEIYRSGVGPANASAENAEGIDNVNGDRMLVQACSIHDIYSTGVYFKGGATDGLVERNRIRRCGGGGVLIGFDTSPEYFDTAANPGYYENIRGTVRNCLIQDTGWEGIGMYAASNPAVFNNTLVNVCTGQIHAALYFGLTYQDWEPHPGRPPSVNPVLLNNLVAQPAGFSDETFEIRYSTDLGGMSALTGFPVMDHNGYSIAGGGVARFTDRRPGSFLEEGTLAQWQAQAGSDSHSLTGDPQFGTDGALSIASPYVNRGTNLAWMSGAVDLAGNPRIQGGVVDIGARESPAGLAIAPSSRVHAAAGANGQTIGVIATVSWTATANQPWIAITGGAAGTNNGMVTYGVAANAGAIRSGTITVSGGGITRTFAVNQWPVPATPGVSAEGDVDGDGLADFSVYHPATGNWHVLFGAGAGWIVPWGWSATLPVPADYNGDGMLDFAVYHPATGNWHIQESATGRPRQIQFGWSATVPLPGDYDGDGRADLAVYHPAAGRWYFLCSTAGRYSVQWGWSSAIPVPADYDGDGITDVAVYHPASGLWQILKSSTGGAIQKRWGWSSALPVPADYDGDGRADIAVFHRASGTWYVAYSGGGSRTQPFGWSTTIPVAADYDGDGAADLAVYHPASGNWYVLKSTTGGIRIQNWGWSSAQPTLLYPLIHSWFGLM